MFLENNYQTLKFKSELDFQIVLFVGIYRMGIKRVGHPLG